MLPVEPLGLKAKQWRFLSGPRTEKYVEASGLGLGRKLVIETTRRQFRTARDILARLNGSNGQPACRGILLADDVGLGKTTVAALVAWVVASAGEKPKRIVRILAPNDVMARRWEEELKSHVGSLQKCAPSLGVKQNCVKTRMARRLSAGSIQVVKHSYAASDLNLACDLLIVDEAHRAKGEKTAFSEALKRQKKHAGRVLILTATPFSIHLDELQRMLTLIGGEAAHQPVRSFSSALEKLYCGHTDRDEECVAKHLAASAKAAVEKLSQFVIRHGIDDLRREKRSFGVHEDWPIDVPQAKSDELEIMIRMARALRMANDDGSESSKATNDPRFSVGWRHLDSVREALEHKVQRLAEPAKTIVEKQIKVITQLRGKCKVHPKMKAIGGEVKDRVKQGEKVILFCHHHETARELTAHLDSVVPKAITPKRPDVKVWEAAWGEVLAPPEDERDRILRDTFIKWLCADLIRAQTRGWLRAVPSSEAELVTALKTTSGRQAGSKAETIAKAAQRLYGELIGSRSSRAVLKAASCLKDLGGLLPGGNRTSRVLGVCEPSEFEHEMPLFIRNRQPDTAISIFNSPFGPDVFVVTDKLSEGIDLHRYCRHLIHYELDPSPIRTVQRNGRLRRVNSWAAVTGKPILYAYPAFRGTRDQRLVQIMKKRLESFSLLLGGVQDFDVEKVVGEKWRNEVIAKARNKIAKAGRQLCAKD